MFIRSTYISACDAHLPRYRKHIGACVHHNEKEDPRQIEALQSGVVLHHQVQKIGNFFHQNRVKSQKQLEKQRRKSWISFDSSQLEDNTFVIKLEWKTFTYLNNMWEAGIVANHPLDFR